MAVRTTYYAFLDLSMNAIQADRISSQHAHVLSFLAAHMIKFEHDSIALAAIDAWMLRQVICNEITVPLQVGPLASVLAQIKRITVPGVVAAAVDAAANLAHRPQRAGGAVLKEECRFGQFLMTIPARLHAPILTNHCATCVALADQMRRGLQCVRNWGG